MPARDVEDGHVGLEREQVRDEIRVRVASLAGEARLVEVEVVVVEDGVEVELRVARHER